MAEPDSTAGAVVVVDHLNQVFETRGEPLVALDDISLRLGAGARGGGPVGGDIRRAFRRRALFTTGCCRV